MQIYSFPTKIHFGAGSRHHLGSFLQASHYSHVGVITDKNVAQLAFFQELLHQLESHQIQIQVFSQVWGNPTEDQVQNGLVQFRDSYPTPQIIIGVGGGAALDVAKAIAFQLESPLILPWVGIPTTAGTGSEVGRSAVISDSRTKIKKVIFSEKLMAMAVFADPELTYGLPAEITAATGMDALTHCIEAFLAKEDHPICDGIALEGIRLAASHLPICVESGSDPNARAKMLMASMMGATAFQKGLGVTHSCAHALSTLADIHHGLANALMIEAALQFNKPAASERFRRMEQTLGVPDFFVWLRELKQKLKIPQGLRDLSIQENQLERLAQLAFADGCHQENPRVCRLEDFQAVFRAAY